MVNVAQARLNKIFKNGGKTVEKFEPETKSNIIPFPKTRTARG